MSGRRRLAGGLPSPSVIDAYFGPFRERRKQLASDPSYAEDVLRDGARRARSEAQQTMALVREAVGFKPAPVVG